MVVKSYSIKQPAVILRRDGILALAGKSYSVGAGRRSSQSVTAANHSS